MPRFVPRESNSFTIHEFIMGTTEDTAGPPLLIYRYAYSASRTGLIFPSNERMLLVGSPLTNEVKFVVCARKLTPDVARYLYIYSFHEKQKLHLGFLLHM